MFIQSSPFFGKGPPNKKQKIRQEETPPPSPSLPIRVPSPYYDGSDPRLNWTWDSNAAVNTHSLYWQVDRRHSKRRDFDQEQRDNPVKPTPDLEAQYADYHARQEAAIARQIAFEALIQNNFPETFHPTARNKLQPYHPTHREAIVSAINNPNNANRTNRQIAHDLEQLGIVIRPSVLAHLRVGKK